MDRSRIIISILLILTGISVLLGLAQIVAGSRDTRFLSDMEGFFSSGKSGIALIEIRGVITDGRIRSGGKVGADAVVRELHQAGKSSGVRGIILYINSPGGSVGATKKIYDAIMRLRQGDKPIIAVISGIAASGGYYVASAADKILAYRGSLIGSIGVISFHLNLSGLLKQYGIRVTPIKSGRFKDASYPFRAMSAVEMAMRQRAQEAAYTQFIRDVAEGRKERMGEVRTKWADARIFSGEQARREKLIDDFGDKEDARILIRKMLRTSASLPILEPKKDFLQELLEVMRPGLRYGAGTGQAIPDNPLQLFQSPALYLYPGSPAFGLEFIRMIGPPARGVR